MATSKKFSELPAASSVGNGDLFAIAHEDAQAETGYVSQKLTAAQAGQKMNGDTEYPTSLPSFPENGQNPFAALEKLNQDIIDLYPVSTASGAIATFSTSLALPLVECKAEIVAQQASGTPTPSSPIPISGFSAVGLTHTGKNLVNLENITNSDVSSTWLWNGKLSGNFVISVDKSKITNVVYPDLYFLRIRVNGTTIDIPYSSNGYAFSGELTRIGCYGSSAYSRVSGVFSIQLEIGSTATAYEAYNGETKTISLGQTVYGGSVDCINGSGSEDYRYDIFDGSSDESWQLVGDDANSLSFRIALASAIKSYNNNGNGVYNWAIYGNAYQSGNVICRGAVNNDGTTFYVIVAKDLNLGITDLATWKTYLSNNNLVAINKLVTPIAITGLTGVNFTTFADQENNIFADCGDVEVSFKQGIQEYIDAKIAETQALIL